ncbi:MAG: serine--tRNA ligase, partial [Porticoccaceae bacterium]|nr:serine--tRNA ligase [Porticoccaceae bacterium]
MIDPKRLRTELSDISGALRLKSYKLDGEQFVKLDAERKQRQIKAENLQAERNQYSKAIGQLIGQAKAKGEDIEPLKAKGEYLKHTFIEAEQAFAVVQQQIEELLHGIPNIPDSSVPPGVDETDNIEVRRWGEIP